ncbi:MAG TPA: hypothetical protein VMU14_24330 [Acidimicrobiales bacterium]|nr:hypothetical protein [Acidimicrobiales bacterium]
MSFRRRALSSAVVVGPGLVLAALWVPWARTGAVTRSAFGLVAALRSAGLLHGAPARALFAVVALVPGLTAATWVLWAARYRRAAAATAVVAGALVAGASLAVRAVAADVAAPSLTWATVAAVGCIAPGALVLVTDHRKAVA